MRRPPRSSGSLLGYQEKLLQTAGAPGHTFPCPFLPFLPWRDQAEGWGDDSVLRRASTRVLLKGSPIDSCDFVREHAKPILSISCTHIRVVICAGYQKGTRNRGYG